MGLGRAAEFRDNETGMHILRMSHSSYRLALAAGFPEDEAELLVLAVQMHDVGKIGIPDHILLKPGRLTPEEWETMRTHCAIGAEIIGNHHSPLLRQAREIALSHHEKWDGGGGLPAGEIRAGL
jgi:putative two-component system response regulator